MAAALFCCPTLVLPLRAGAAGGLGAPQTPASSLLGWALAVEADGWAELAPGERATSPFAPFFLALGQEDSAATNG